MLTVMLSDRKKSFCLLPLGVTVMCLAVPAEGEFSITLNGSTNYVYRGYSKSDDHPVAQLNLDYEHEKSGIFIGVWTSMVDFGEDEDEFDDPAKVEISPYIGWC